jgi:hypothetical protein
VYINKKTFEWSMTKTQNDMEHYIVYNKCVKCTILPTCRGDLKNAHGITPIEDIKIRFAASTPDFWIAQGECEKPVRRGMMVYNFSEACVESKIDWSIFMNRYGVFDRSRFMLVAGKDFNYSPDATLLCVIDRQTDDIYVIKEFRMDLKTMPTICSEILEWCAANPFGVPEDIQCDKSEPGLIATMKASGLGMAQAVEDSDVEGGIDLINYLCKPRIRPPMVHIDKRLCPTFVWELQDGYKRKIDPKTGEPGEDPDARNNHFVDCFRYVVWKYMQKYAQAYETIIGNNSFTSAISEAKKALGGAERGGIDEDELAKLAVLLNEKVVQ